MDTEHCVLCELCVCLAFICFLKCFSIPFLLIIEENKGYQICVMWVLNIINWSLFLNHTYSGVECEVNIFNRIYIMHFVHWEFECQTIVKWHLWTYLVSSFFLVSFLMFSDGEGWRHFFLEVKDSVLYKVKWVNRILTLHFRLVISKELFSNFINLCENAALWRKNIQ